MNVSPEGTSINSALSSIRALLKSELLTIAITSTELVLTVSNWLALVDLSSTAFLFLAIAGMVIAACLQMGNIIKPAAFTYVVLASAVALVVGIVKIGKEIDHTRSAPVKLPLILVRAFWDKDNDGVRGTYERFVGPQDNIKVEFSPLHSKSERQLLDSSVTFNKFQPGEVVTVEICDIEKDVTTYAIDDKSYKLVYEVNIPIPDQLFKNCVTGGLPPS